MTTGALVRRSSIRLAGTLKSGSGLSGAGIGYIGLLTGCMIAT